MTFPSALSLGIRALDEVMETELTEPVEVEDFADRLRAQAPPGLVISHVTALGPGERKARVQRFTYEFPVPEPRRPGVAAAIGRLLAQDRMLVEREGRSDPVDVRAGLLGLELVEGGLRFVLAADEQVTVRPREVLSALELADLERDGSYLTRTRVELTMQARETKSEADGSTAGAPVSVLAPRAGPGSQQPLPPQSHSGGNDEEGNADQRVAAGGVSDRDR